MSKSVDNMEQFKQILAEAGDKVVIIDFYADWCGPCKQIAPRFKQLSEKCSNIITLKVNVDDADDVAEFCEVQAMPTFAVFKNGEKVDSLLGANGDKLDELFNKYN